MIVITALTNLISHLTLSPSTALLPFILDNLRISLYPLFLYIPYTSQEENVKRLPFKQDGGLYMAARIEFRVCMR